jgi:hypothetical protein
MRHGMPPFEYALLNGVAPSLGLENGESRGGFSLPLGNVLRGAPSVAVGVRSAAG